jgi:branched-subunit amino acid transport protein
MQVNLLLLIIIIGLMTYGLRALPLLLTLRRQRDASPRMARLDLILKLAGPSLLAGLLAVSVVPPADQPAAAGQFLHGLVVLGLVALVYRRVPNLGVAVLVGISAYALLQPFFG